jgi:hypothetical protein
MLAQLCDVYLERLDKPYLAGTEARARHIFLGIEVNVVEIAQEIMWTGPVECAADDWNETLGTSRSLLHLPLAHVGFHRIRRQHEHNGVALEDEQTETLFPILGAVNALAVDDDMKTLPLKGRRKLVRELEVSSRVGDEDLELLSRCSAGFCDGPQRRFMVNVPLQLLLL